MESIIKEEPIQEVLIRQKPKDKNFEYQKKFKIHNNYSKKF